MQFINYFFASVVSFLGLLIGIILVKIAPEEQKPLEKYFVLLRRILLLLIFIFLMFYYIGKVFYILTLASYLAFLLFVEYKLDDSIIKSMLIYTVLGILFFASASNLNLFVMDSSLILLYGIPTASLMYSRKDKNYARVFLTNLGFIIVSAILFFI